MHRVAAKFVPRLLTEEQKQNRVTVRQELFHRSNTDENFLENIITSDEMWVYGYDVETKCSRRSGWEIPRHDQKITSESLNCEGDVDFFLIGRVFFIMSLFHVKRQSINSFT